MPGCVRGLRCQPVSRRYAARPVTRGGTAEPTRSPFIVSTTGLAASSCGMAVTTGGERGCLAAEEPVQAAATRGGVSPHWAKRDLCQRMARPTALDRSPGRRTRSSGPTRPYACRGACVSGCVAFDTHRGRWCILLPSSVCRRSLIPPVELNLPGCLERQGFTAVPLSVRLRNV